MPKLPTEEPEYLRPYLFHRVELEWKGASDAQGTCPFCDGAKFFVSQSTGQYDCKHCARTGNNYTFIRAFHEHCVGAASDAEFEEAAADRKVSVATLKRWGLVKSVLNGEWMLPAYGPRNGGPPKINNLYRWSLPTPHAKKRALLSTTGMSACLFGMQFFDPKKPYIDVTEGPWDGMGWEEALRNHNMVEDAHVRCTPGGANLYNITNVVSVPGQEVFKEEWLDWFKDRHVRLLYDNDEPKVNRKTGELLAPAGYNGMKKAAMKLVTVAASVKVLIWAEGGYNPNLPKDIRDYDDSAS